MKSPSNLIMGGLRGKIIIFRGRRTLAKFNFNVRKDQTNQSRQWSLVTFNREDYQWNWQGRTFRRLQKSQREKRPCHNCNFTGYVCEGRRDEAPAPAPDWCWQRRVKWSEGREYLLSSPLSPSGWVRVCDVRWGVECQSTIFADQTATSTRILHNASNIKISIISYWTQIKYLYGCWFPATNLKISCQLTSLSSTDLVSKIFWNSWPLFSIT